MANVTPWAYREMINALEKFRKNMINDAGFLTKSAAILYHGMNGDSISTRLKSRVERSAKEIDDLCTSVDHFKKSLEEELEQIENALKNNIDD
ncbi:MAG: hypothetical protein J6K72_10190 [Clostridia bacterium]|nr:hypothetical protein [Clostridia bacterium]